MLTFGPVTEKKIQTPNQFVSHMIEHIAWRLGVKIDLIWEDENWLGLGILLGKQISALPQENDQKIVCALGMIDDGSAEVKIEFGQSNLELSAIKNVDLNWFLNLRCEQLENSLPLQDLLQGLTKGLKAKVQIKIWNFEDQHHTWEGIFRAIGIALSRRFKAPKEISNWSDQIEKSSGDDEICVLKKSANFAQVRRGTAETGITLSVDFKHQKPNQFKFEIDESIELEGIETLFNELTEQAGFSLEIYFSAKVLSSSHVVWEDIGLVLGKALLEIAKLRMEEQGINGAGSSLQTPADYTKNQINVGLSIEGRKFWRFVPADSSDQELQKRFLIGQNFKQIRSEDLDDFIDGFTGGLSASLIVHLVKIPNARQGWLELFQNLGRAIKEAFEVNSNRKGVPPGVKATLG